MLSLFCLSIYADLMLDLVNTQRSKAGAGPLAMDVDCMAASKAHTEDQASHLFMGHVGSDGSTLSDRITATGFKWDAIAENVAEGQKTVEEVMTAWMNSPEHRANLLNPVYTRFGYCQQVGSDGNIYWTQDFAHPMGGFTPPDVTVPTTPAVPSTPVAPPPTVPFQTPAPAPSVTAPSASPISPMPTPASSLSASANSAMPSTAAPSPSLFSASPSPLTSAASNATSATPAKPSIIPIEATGMDSHLDFLSAHCPRIIFSLLPSNVQQFAGDNKQYTAKIIDSLKSQTAAAIPSAHYYAGHPGQNDKSKFGSTTYAEFSANSSGSTLNALVVITLISYL